MIELIAKIKEARQVEVRLPNGEPAPPEVVGWTDGKHVYLDIDPEWAKDKQFVVHLRYITNVPCEP